MKISNLTKKDISIISINDITRYLVRRGFDFRGMDNSKKNNIFTKKLDQNNRDITLPVPNSEKYIDYIERVFILINALGVYLQTEPSIIYSEIIHSIKDIVKMRVLNPGEYHNSLPLDYAAREIEGLKDLFLYSACSEVIELPYFDKPLSEGQKHIQTCQFGHTFEGSFGFSINIPIMKKEQLLLIEDRSDIPFERKVTERVIRGLSVLETAVKENTSDPLINSFETTFNARMCDSIIEMSIGKTKELEIFAEWSLEYEPNKELLFEKPFRIGGKEIEILEDASEKLKKVEPFEQIIIGNVVTLHSKNDPNLEENFLRTIAMRHEYEGRSVEVKIYLNREDYMLAYAAHGFGRKIEVHGKLFRTGSTWKMNEVSSVKYYV